MRLLEFGKGEAVEATAHHQLFHLTTYDKFAAILSSNRIVGGAGGVSLTWNPNMNRVVGKKCSYKFALDGLAVLRDYPAIYYDDFARDPNGGKHSHQEDEVRITAPVIENLSSYVTGIVFLGSLYTENSLQELLYRYDGDKQAIDALLATKYPVGSSQRGTITPLSDEDRRYLRFAKEASKGKNFDQSLYVICQEYDITGHDRNIITTKKLDAEYDLEDTIREINKLSANIPLDEIDVGAVWKLAERYIAQHAKQPTEILSAIRRAALRSKFLAPADLLVVMRYGVTDTVEEITPTLNKLKKEITAREEFSQRGFAPAPHYPTMSSGRRRHQ